MTTRQMVLDMIPERGSITGGELRRQLALSRQALHAHLRVLVRDNLVVKEGQTRGATYRRATPGDAAGPALRRLARTYLTEALAEDAVFAEFSALLQLDRAAGKTGGDIFQYAFTEMLNNAVEHSRSKRCRVEMAVGPYDLSFVVRDFGIGVFHSIASKFGLRDENAALAELLKGKTTTMQEKHTGEGIFFTSKAGDRMALRSQRIEVVFDNKLDDVIVAQRKRLRGTEIRFAVSRRSRRKLAEVFSAYAPEEFGYRFERTRVLVSLARDDYVSRSEARRMLSGLDRFREVILDFTGVKSIGQGFADEVFRVFRRQHPQTIIRAENVPPVIETVLRHVVDKKEYRDLTID